MKLGIVGTGNVGCAIALAAATRGSAREIVLVNRTRKVAEAVATDLRYGIPLGPRIDISDGDYDALNGAGVVLITSGVNEKAKRLRRLEIEEKLDFYRLLNGKVGGLGSLENFSAINAHLAKCVSQVGTVAH